MATKTIRVVCRNNSDARNFGVLDNVHSAKSKHNGMKNVIVTCDDDEVEKVRGILESSWEVSSFEVQS